MTTHSETYDATKTLQNTMIGYGEQSIDALKDIIEFRNWQQRAQQELEHRRTRLIEFLDNETLAALADGTVNMQAAAYFALNKLKKPTE